MSLTEHLVAEVPLAVWLLVDALATYRATRLITRDSIPVFQTPRDAVTRRWGDRALGYLVECPWCVSVWIGAGVVTARLTVPDWWTLLALVLAFSAVTGWLAEHE